MGAVHHITTVTDLNNTKDSVGLKEVDTGIVLLCTIVSESSYLAGTPLGVAVRPQPCRLRSIFRIVELFGARSRFQFHRPRVDGG